MDRGCINRCGNVIPWDRVDDVCKSCREYERQYREYREAHPRARRWLT